MIGNNIKAIRSAYGLSQEDLAKKLGVSNRAVSTWETGKRTPLMGVVQQLSDMFHIEKSDLIDGNLTTQAILSMKTNKDALNKLYNTAKCLPEEKVEYLIKMAESLM